MVASPKHYHHQADYHDWICPDLRDYWQLVPDPNSAQVILQALQGNPQFQFSTAEGYALRHFTGKFTVQQIQAKCSKKLTNTNPDLVAELLDKLIVQGILAFNTPNEVENCQNSSGIEGRTSVPSPLNSSVQWVKQPDGYWILRNSESGTFMQVSDLAKRAIDQLGCRPKQEIGRYFGQDRFRELLQQLACTGMLVGTTPPQRHRGKFTPLSLLFFKIPLGNPDPWLTRHTDKLGFVWTSITGLCLCVFFALTAVISWNEYITILSSWQALWQSQRAALFLSMGLLSMLVVTLHELGHAFTLKHYGNRVPHLNLQVPEVGLMFMCLMPTAYTNTTDSYCLVKRYQRVLVVAAGVLVQLLIAAMAFWLWMFSTDWLKTTSSLLLGASLFTVALNLNPLAKFDGYYLAVAVTGINSLRSRSKALYLNWLRGKPTNETQRDSYILAAYAPFSLAYIFSVFSFLLYRVAEWSLTFMPLTIFFLLLVWAIYFFFPTQKG